MSSRAVPGGIARGQPTLPLALSEAPVPQGEERDGDQDPCPPRHPTPPPHPAGLIHTTTIQALFPPTDYCASYSQPPAARLLALGPQGHVYTKTEGTRSRRECSCFSMCSGPAHTGRRGVKDGRGLT